MLIISHDEVEALLNIDELIDALAPAMVALSSGRVSMPQRIAAMVEDAPGLLAAMPVYLPQTADLAAKLVAVYPRNPHSGLTAHQALIAVFDARTGIAQAILEGTWITAARTAAGSALSARLLARQDARVLLIVGGGVQAWAHILALPRVRPIAEIRIVTRNLEQGTRLAVLAQETTGIPSTAVASFGEAAHGADIICATTHAAEPVVFGDGVEPGTHICSVGLNPGGRELDEAAVLRSLVFVESREAALSSGPGSANDLLIPLREGKIGHEHITAEIGEVVSGAHPGRTDTQQITLYKSVGVAVQDAVAARLVLEVALAQGAGTEVDF